MTDNKDGAEKATIKILNGYTKNTKFSYGYEFPIGLIGDIEKALNEFYDAGVKDGAKAERERAAKIVDPAPGSVILCCSVDCGTKIAEILKKKAEAIREEPA